jgi:hypothetical protein
MELFIYIYHFFLLLRWRVMKSHVAIALNFLASHPSLLKIQIDGHDGSSIASIVNYFLLTQYFTSVTLILQNILD